ncbi:NnrU family protein [Sedimenticola selenatireducens]|uniref:NnrU family protein n=1 Tax=Sedimenticola selenatireducens TaxID=191960 RepID=UPI00048F529B|nr:NnrU family protein [Sedimenticola selenatireducens]
MTLLIAGLALFFISHSISIINEPWRNRMAAQLGETVWQGLYGLVALAGLVFIVWGYGLAQQTPVPLYTPPPWARSANLLLMLPVFPLLVATYFPGRIGAAVKHPMLLATLLWALAHLLVTGTLASLLLFGCFLIWAIADRLSMRQRVQRPLLGAPPSAWNDLIALLAGLALYVSFLFWLHGWLFGVAPIVQTF